MPNLRTVFVTGGAGYIGSHCVVELLNAGYEVIAIDNFVNSVDGEHGESIALKRVEEITNKTITFYKCDLLDKQALDKIFRTHNIDCVIHFAAIKAVGESMQFPLLYYKNNLIGMINLLEVMAEHNCYQLVFSSSCTVYGEPEHLPITEDHSTGKVTNVYGRTKFFIEEMLKDITNSNQNWNIISLRYFNPVGAHPSGLIGEDPTKAFTNIMPYIAQVALGKKDSLTIFGGDYETVDGTGVRDYIHIMDLATGHVAALNMLKKTHLRLKASVPGIKMLYLMKEIFQMYNLGTGSGVSVLQLVKVFEKVTNTKVPYEIVARRTGDIKSMYANPDLAEKELNWKAVHTLESMCEDFWRWQTMNPNGYRNQGKKLNGHH